MGFRPQRSTEDALLILESVISNSFEYNVPLWFASLDLKKAFDKIEWPQLFHALNVHHVGLEYQHLASFPILRGVRQGDVLSPLLFNTGLDLVMSRWKARLHKHGIKMDEKDTSERLTNVRFADDLVIYASLLEELTEMLDILVEELQVMGLELNASKSKIFTTDQNVIRSLAPVLVDVGGGFIEIARDGKTHDYLGIKLPGNLLDRGPVIVASRARSAWAKFHMFRSSLLNKHVNIKLRLRLFDSIVSPCVLYGLSTALLTEKTMHSIGVIQRKMIRTMIGYVKLPGDDWADMYRKVNFKMETAFTSYPVCDWCETLRIRKSNLYGKIVRRKGSPLTCQAALWLPSIVHDDKLQQQGRRGRGAPRVRWDHK